MSHKLLALAGATCLLMTGCTDSDYDLSDIDTTSKVTVNNLTLPINIDKMRLDDAFELDDNSNIKIVDGYYALSETGTFQSDPIRIEPILIPAPIINPTIHNLVLPFNNRRKAPVADISIPHGDSRFVSSTVNVDPAIKSIEKIYTGGTPLVITIGSNHELPANSELKDLKFSLPAGMAVSNVTAGNYDASTGVWTIPSLSVTTGYTAKASLLVNMIDLAHTELSFDKVKNTLSFASTVGLKEGSLSLDLGAITEHFHDLALTIDYNFSDIDVTGFTGIIEYPVEGVNIDPVVIDDLPDFLKGDGTNLKIANPQLYISLNNPVGNNGLKYETGFRLTALRDNGVPAMSFTPDNNGKINVGHNLGVDGPYNFLLAPQQTQAPGEYASNLQFVKFSSLSDLLSVPESDASKATLPDRININLINPELPEQHADNFPVGRSLTSVEGKYELLAPLGFKEGSVVVYEDTQDGWSDDFLEALTISSLTITAAVDNDAPVSAQLEAYPIDTTGNHISNVSVTSNVVEANAKDQNLEIVMTGVIKDLDGINIRAIMRSGNDQTPLSPDQTLTFKNVRITVTGDYTKEL